MKKKTLTGLVICYFIINTCGNGLMPLMPLFVQQHGAHEGFAGVYTALAYLCLAVGTMIGGRISDFAANRKLLLVLLSICLAPVTFMLGRADLLVSIIILTSIQWIVAGFCMAIIGTITGREADESERGRVFGLLGVSIGVGALAGGFSIGPLVDARGYSGMFTVMAGFIALLPLTASLLIRETFPGESAEQKVLPKTRLSSGRSTFKSALVVLIIAQFFGLIANGVGNMTRSIVMNQLDFSNSALTSTVAVSGIISIPTVLYLGWLSDKLGRKKILIISYLSGTLCLLILIFAAVLWQFLLSAAMLSMAVVSMSVGPAFAADIVKKESVGTGIAFIQSIQLLGAVAGFIYTGYAIVYFGTTVSLLIASLGGVAAALLILFVHTSKPTFESVDTEE